MQDSIQKLVQAMQTGSFQQADCGGAFTQSRSTAADQPADKQTTYKRQTTPPANPSTKQANKGDYKSASPSPAYQVPEEGVWNQSYLAKALQNMKDVDFAKLKISFRFK